MKSDELADEPADFYALVFTGFIDIPEKDLYRLTLKSDDGSRLFIDGKLLVDNDGPHPVQEFSGLTRLDKGLVPIRVEFFEGIGNALLELRLQKAGDARKIVGADMFFHDKSAKD